MRKKLAAWTLMTVMAVGLVNPGSVKAEEIKAATQTQPQALASEWATSGALMKDGSLWMWGSNENGQVGDGTKTDRAMPTRVLENVKNAVTSEFMSAAIREDGSLWTWGSNIYGELGDGTTEDKMRPVKVLEKVKDVSISGSHSMAVKEDGSLWTWGSNLFGQVGDGTVTDCVSPVKIMDRVKSIAAGSFCSMALQEDGSLWLWGDNECGQLGDGTTVNKAVPVKVMDHVKSICAWNFCSAAVKEDGSLWVWGDNEYGQLGDGAGTNKITPVKLMDGVKEVCIGGDKAAAVKDDGSLWLWGRMGYEEQTEDIVPVIRTNPVKIMDDVKVVKLGYNECAAIKKDGSLWMLWFLDSYTEPEKMLDNVQDVGVSQFGYVAVKTDGSVWTWGDGIYGQLGDGRYGEDVVWQDIPKEIMNRDGGKAFLDVSGSDWYYNYINYISANELMTGMDGDHFGPANPLARAQFAVILYRMNNTPKVNYVSKFPDVTQGTWYTDAILWANSIYVVNGYSDTGLFGVADNITREQMAVMMYRYAEAYKGYDVGKKADFQAFRDAASVSEFAYDAMRWAVGNGIITGKDNGTRLDPQGSASRAECAAIMMRFIEKYGK